MNINTCKVILYQILEELRAAQYMDWLKGYLCIHLIYGSVRLISILAFIMQTTQNVTLLLFVELFFTVATQILITTILSCVIWAFLSFMCIKYMPQLFVAFTVIKDIMFSLTLTIGFIKVNEFSSSMAWLIGTLSFLACLVVMFGLTYLLIRLVIRSSNKRLKLAHE